MKENTNNVKGHPSDTGGENPQQDGHNNHENPSQQSGIGLDAPSCSCPDSQGETGLSPSSNPVQESQDTLTSDSPSVVAADSRPPQEVLASSDICSNRKKGNGYVSSDPLPWYLQGKNPHQSQVWKIYWHGSLVDRILDSNDKMKLILDSGEIVILSLKEFNDFIRETQEKQQFA